MFVRDYPTDDGKGVERVVGTLKIGALDNFDKAQSFILNVVRGQSTVSVAQLQQRYRLVLEQAYEECGAMGKSYCTLMIQHVGRTWSEVCACRWQAHCKGKEIIEDGGLVLTIMVGPLGSTTTVDLMLGTGPAPKIRKCVGYGAEVWSGETFCGGVVQSSQPGVQTPLVQIVATLFPQDLSFVKSAAHLIRLDPLDSNLYW